MTKERKCRVCGCTDNDCSQCIKKTGKPCYWVEKDLCSACDPTNVLNNHPLLNDALYDDEDDDDDFFDDDEDDIAYYVCLCCGNTQEDPGDCEKCGAYALDEIYF